MYKTWIVSQEGSYNRSEMTEKFGQSACTLELSKGSRKLRNKIDLVAWSVHVTTDDQSRSNQSDSQPKD